MKRALIDAHRINHDSLPLLSDQRPIIGGHEQIINFPEAIGSLHEDLLPHRGVNR